MNFIRRMQAENADLKAKLELAQRNLSDLIALLHSPKFTGTESDGARKDWIATGDVIAWARETRSEITI